MCRIVVIAAVALLTWVATELGSTFADTSTPSATPLQVPSAPTNLQFDFFSSPMTWEDHSDNEDGFRLEKLVDGVWVQMATYPANTTSGAFPGITHDEQCDGIPIHLVAYNSVGDSEPSNLLSILPLPSGCRDTFDFTYTNDSGSAADHLFVATYGAYDLTIVANAPGCSEPATVPFRVDVTWPTPCVDPGESVSVQFDLISPFYWGEPKWALLAATPSPTPTPHPTLSPSMSPSPSPTITPVALPEAGGAPEPPQNLMALVALGTVLLAGGAFALKRIR